MVDDINVEEFIIKLNNGQQIFKNICVEDYSFVLKDFILDNLLFEESFVNINFKNCSLKKVVFKGCNLKYIRFIDCDMTNANISECSIESMELQNCNIKDIIFGQNYSYGIILDSKKCYEIYKQNNVI